MFLSGIADEAGKPIETQIRAHQEIGWTEIEVRLVDSVSFSDMPDDKFDYTFGKIQDAGMHVSCFASKLGNWATPIDTDFQQDIDELKTAIPRMHRCDCPFMRTMSWPNAKNPWPDDKWKAEAIRRMKELAKIAEDGGVTLVHENCSGWAGQGPEQALEMFAAVDSPALKAVYDTGNVIGHGQDGWDYYNALKPHIVYVHIKDRKRLPDGKVEACYAGEGAAYVREIATDLLKNGYDGGFSIEPHIAAAVHAGKEAEDERAYNIYVTYGKGLTQLIEEVKAAL